LHSSIGACWGCMLCSFLVQLKTIFKRLKYCTPPRFCHIPFGYMVCSYKLQSNYTHPSLLPHLQVLAIEGRSLLLGGADVVDGSPVLDIKPFLPFADAVPGATAPPWVRVSP
jgi:hypothetical protein